ncbi:PhzF family phenazine biosynthesis protein [Salinicola aestuarinus]|uniref:PhzF family phenazine biosynthesis protein n=1 Tax=Salinicola aestuarinus TaxID=1949082 RepID=UPI001FDA1AD6|nr:PhzF family phenazine biosynthesis protein [Salinicola aestuarinus]
MSHYLHDTSVIGGRTAHHYVLLDVFTDEPFCGNPLAVFPEASTIDETDMARIAGELNLSETVFVTGRQSGRFTVRIFTPEVELPFAGHPTVGTAWLIRALDWHDGVSPLVLAQGAGDVAIRFVDQRVQLTTAQPLEVSEHSLSMDHAAAVLGLSPSNLVAPPVMASCGTPYHLIELASPEALAQITVDGSALRSVTAGFDTSALYVFVRESEQALRARMFAPLTGTPEDPATGSAAAPLIGYLSSQGEAQGTLDWSIAQGVERGRPSHLLGQVECHAGRVTAIHISGDAVIVGEGTLYL